MAAKNVPVVFKTGTTRVLPLVFTDFAASILAGEDDVVPGTTVRVGVSQIVSVIPEADQWQNVAYEEGRARFVEALGDALLDPASQRPMLILVSLAETFRSNGDERLKRIADDITHKDANLGQIVLALRNWREWGQHYLPAVHNAHHRGERASFKEASAKNYGGPALEKLVDEGERIFVQIRRPSRARTTTTTAAEPGTVAGVQVSTARLRSHRQAASRVAPRVAAAAAFRPSARRTCPRSWRRAAGASGPTRSSTRRRAASFPWRMFNAATPCARGAGTSSLP